MKQISLLGCGWLGLPLAKSLIEKGFSVKGSTTSSDKISDLEKAGIEAFLIEVLEKNTIGSIENFLDKSEILIIDIPPKLRGNQSDSFVEKIEYLIPFIEKSSVQKVLFVSSISVFADDNTTLNEASFPNPESESGKQIVASENLLLNNKYFQTSIVRFGGLIGENRHPIHYLSGKKEIENPDAPINLIHQLDCIGIIESVIEKDIWNEIFHGVAPFHPSKKEYYTQKAIDLKLSLPEFKKSSSSNGKIIMSTKTQSLLDYSYLKTNL